MDRGHGASGAAQADPALVRTGPLRFRRGLLESHPDHGGSYGAVRPVLGAHPAFGRPGNLALPFFHLRSDGFWHLLPKHEDVRLGSQIASLVRLREEVIGARLDDDLYDLIL